MIIFILAAFLLSTALTSIMYLGGNKNAQTTTGENMTWTETEVVVETLPAEELATGTTDATGIISTGSN